MSVSVDPNFKSTLPPRKRAKTQEEKEQRRMERILRNRRAAHALREKKRRHVESLEAYVLALEKNNSLLTLNVEKLSATAPKSVLATLEQPVDLSGVKASIASVPSTSMDSTTCGNAMSPYSTESSSQHNSLPSDGDISDHEQTTVKLEPLSPNLVAEKCGDNGDFSNVEELDVVGGVDSNKNFYNYLSPVSLHSPIDLTLKQEPSSSLASLPSFDFSVDQNGIVPLPTSRLDYLAQNSEVILFPRAIFA